VRSIPSLSSYPESPTLYLEPVDVALLHQLMSSSYQLQSVYVAEVVGHLRPEDPAGTAGVDGPIFDVLRVRPHEVAERTFVGDLDPAVNRADLVDRLDFGR
jgi:hypothetical protein